MEGGDTSGKKEPLKYVAGQTTTEQLTAEKLKIAEGDDPNIIHLYHGTDAVAAERILAEGVQFFNQPFHDFAMGKNTAFYTTPSFETAQMYAVERINMAGTKPATVVRVTVRRDRVKMWEFADVEKWEGLIKHNRDRDRPKGKLQHEKVREYDIVAGWISTQNPAGDGYVPVAYLYPDGGSRFAWQYVIVSEHGRLALEDVRVVWEQAAQG